MFRQLIANNSTQDWTQAVFAAAAFMLVLQLLRSIALHHLKKVEKKEDTQIVDFFIDVLSTTRILLALAIGLYMASHFLNLPPPIEKSVDRAFIGLVILQVGFWANRGLVFWLTRHFSSGTDSDAGSRAMTLSLLKFLGRMVLWALVGLLVLDNLGLNVTTLVASLGIGGIAVALAVQNILGDLFASLSIAIDKPFVIGDFIVVDNMMGNVEHVGLKTTRIRSQSGEQIVMSNTDLLKSRIRNYKHMQERRVAFVIGVTYDTVPEQLEQLPALLTQAVNEQPGVRMDRAHFKGFSPSSLDFEVVYFVLKPDYSVYMDIQQAINLYLVRAFALRGIGFAFPTQTLHIASTPPTTNAPTPAPQ